MLNSRGGGQAVQASLSFPQLPGYQSKTVLLILLILNYLNVMMYQLHTKFKSNSAVCFVALFCILSCRGGGKLSRPVYFDPTHLGIKVKLFC